MNSHCFVTFFFNSPHLLLAPSQVAVSLSKEVKDGKPSLRVNWTAPQGDENITLYIVQDKVTGVPDWGNQKSIEPHQTAVSLIRRAGTTYDVRVRAVSAAGSGVWSDVQTETTYNSEFKCCYWLHVVDVAHF